MAETLIASGHGVDAETRRLMSALGYAGLLPFYGAATWAALGLPCGSVALDVFVVYGVSILAFLGGTLWGYAASVEAAAKRPRLLLSNVVALFAAVCGLMGDAAVAVILLLAGQLALLDYERSRGDKRHWYLRLRTRLVLGVLPAHALALFAIKT